MSTPININTSAKDINTISKEIILSKNPELNYYAVLNLGVNKINHLQIIIESKDPLLNYKCVKHCIKTPSLTKEEKKLLVAMHSQVIYHSKNQKIINELEQFLKYNPINKKYSALANNHNKSRNKKRIRN